MTRKRRSALGRFLASETLGGWLLLGAAALALIAANSGLAAPYRALLESAAGPMSVHHWINDALMAVFFLLVGLEIKRAFTAGELADRDSRRLPLIAAAAGMAAPALVYLAIAGGAPGLARGWAIPAATDIAFALAVLALLGRRVPASLRLFLVTVAIADDLGAVAIIAIVYSGALNLAALAAAAALLAGLWLAGRAGALRLWLYVPGAVLLWYAVWLSGVHATVAGVLAAAIAPGPLLHRLEDALARPVGWLIVPLFGFANAGVALGGGGWLAPLPLAIALGLFLGKQAGIFGAVRLCARVGLAAPPRGATWLQIYGVALLSGIGFTMSLFIGALAFPGDPATADQAKAGILIGSLLSAAAGYGVLRLAANRATF
ncbi:MAG TPA: Na+/H+ antiporter NhaA [Allosphingosinicella sp.]|nr:Na+/H+ antiporter NhaA [Allosphingosinicella sp.]